MKNVKKIIALTFTIMFVLITLSACNNTNSNNKNPEKNSYKIGIVQYISHPSLDNSYNGIMEMLNSSDYSDKIIIDRQIGSDASADSDCATYAKNMVAAKYDLIVAIATPAASSVYAATEGTDIPVVFCAVSDPVKAELVATLETPGDSCTGTSDILDLKAQIDLIQSLQPDVRTIGILYTTSEANSISNLEVFKRISAERGLSVEATGVQSAADIPSAAAALVSKVDCINNFNDNNIVNNLLVLLDAAKTSGIPVYGSEIEQVKKGCLASVSIDYVALGKVTGEMIVDILNGGTISTMSVRTISDATPVVNTQVLASLNMTMPATYINAETVLTTD